MNKLKQLSMVMAAAVIAAPAAAQDKYPEKPVTVVIGFAAGGITDLATRILTERLQDKLGQPFLVENKGGAGGRIGAETVMRAAPDGYTLTLGNAGTHAVLPAAVPKLSYDPVEDFTMIAPVGAHPFFLLCNPSRPYKTVKELIAAAKAAPGTITYGSAGLGGQGQMINEYFQMLADIEMKHVPYNGTGPMVQALIGGSIDCGFDGASKAHIDAGTLHALAVTSAERDPRFPDIPTLAEEGLTGFDLRGWQGIMGPADMPEEIVAKLNTTINEILALDEVKQRYLGVGITAEGGTPEDLKARMEADLEVYRRIADETGLELL